MVRLLVFLFWATSPSPFPYEPKLEFSVSASPNSLGVLLGTWWSCSGTALPPPLSQPGPGGGCGVLVWVRRNRIVHLSGSERNSSNTLDPSNI